MMIPWPSQPVEVSRGLGGHERRFRSAHLWRTAHDFIAMQAHTNVLREFDGAATAFAATPRAGAGGHAAAAFAGRVVQRPCWRCSDDGVFPRCTSAGLGQGSQRIREERPGAPLGRHYLPLKHRSCCVLSSFVCAAVACLLWAQQHKPR